MRALVIGSHGFIGSRVVSRLLDEGATIYGIDSLSIYKPENLNQYYKNLMIRHEDVHSKLIKFKRAFVSDPQQITEIDKEFKPTHIINCAGISVADVCAKSITEAVSSIYLLNSSILQGVKDSNTLERYIYLSSSMIYGDFEVESPSENFLPNPKDPYGAIKLGGESLIKSFNRQWGLPFTIVRPSAVYGPLDSNLRVTGIFMSNASNGKPLIVADKNESLDFTFIEDTVSGIVSSINSSKAQNQTYNISRGEARTILKLAEIIAGYFPGVEIEVRDSVEFMEGLARPKRGALDISKARQELSFNPVYNLEKGIEKYVEFWQNTYN